MRRRWFEIQKRNRDIDAMAERLELRIHIIALVLTAIVLAMRLVTGTTDLTGDAADAEGLAAEADQDVASSTF